MKLKDMNIKQVDFPATQYFKQETAKKQIYLHHTAGGGDAERVFRHWASSRERIATCVTVGADGLIAQGFSSKYWAWHLGVSQKEFSRQGIPYQNLNKSSIGIEICNFGYLKEKNGKFVNYVGREIPMKNVTKLDEPFKGFLFWQSYTKEQIESVRQLLLYWNEVYEIPLDYNEDIWGLSKRALAGEPGVFTHNSVRKDKSDVYPHPELIEMLKSCATK